MKIPDSYYEYAAAFYPQLPEEVSSEEEFILRGLAFLTIEQQNILKVFLTKALADGCTIDELQRAWISVGPRFGYSDNNLRGFLQMTRQLIP